MKSEMMNGKTREINNKDFIEKEKISNLLNSVNVLVGGA